MELYPHPLIKDGPIYRTHMELTDGAHPLWVGEIRKQIGLLMIEIRIPYVNYHFFNRKKKRNILLDFTNVDYLLDQLNICHM